MTIDQLVDILTVEKRPDMIRDLVVWFVKDEIIGPDVDPKDFPDARQAATLAHWLHDRQTRIVEGADPVGEEIPNVVTMLAFLESDAYIQGLSKEENGCTISD